MSTATITIEEPKTVIKYEATASRDHEVILIPGTYELKADIRDENLYYVSAIIPAIAPERIESTVEFGGVALASQTVPECIEAYTLSLHGFQLKSQSLGVVHGLDQFLA